eukprot:TRINITY_DN17691_c0_g1_i1.p1 TRINITY_DN17691_c0_g1~~TRINITY_DN17691_c0_g1_i1.p1  ORF type:complete len:782 (-),score=166.27 TRINITY_DN17691_c0_g1_i1:216-2561(-)
MTAPGARMPPPVSKTGIVVPRTTTPPSRPAPRQAPKIVVAPSKGTPAPKVAKTAPRAGTPPPRVPTVTTPPRAPTVTPPPNPPTVTAPPRMATPPSRVATPPPRVVGTPAPKVATAATRAQTPAPKVSTPAPPKAGLPPPPPPPARQSASLVAKAEPVATDTSRIVPPTKRPAVAPDVAKSIRTSSGVVVPAVVKKQGATPPPPWKKAPWGRASLREDGEREAAQFEEAWRDAMATAEAADSATSEAKQEQPWDESVDDVDEDARSNGPLDGIGRHLSPGERRVELARLSRSQATAKVAPPPSSPKGQATSSAAVPKKSDESSDAKSSSKGIYAPRVKGQGKHVKAEKGKSEKGKSERGKTAYVFYVPSSWTDADLERHFEHCGTITKATLGRKDDGVAKGFGFVTFTTREAVLKAVVAMDNFAADKGQFLSVNPKRGEEDLMPSIPLLEFDAPGDVKLGPTGGETPRGGSIFVYYLPQAWSDRDLFDHFNHLGTITTARVITKRGREDGDGSKGYGFVGFAKVLSAARAVKAMNGFNTGERKRLHVTIKKGEEDASAKYTEALSCVPDAVNRGGGPESHKGLVPPGANLYVSRLPFEWTEAELQALFEPHGRIVSCSIGRSTEGASKGYGFVGYSQSQSAQQAIAALDGATVEGSTTPIAVRQKRDSEGEKGGAASSEGFADGSKGGGKLDGRGYKSGGSASSEVFVDGCKGGGKPDGGSFKSGWKGDGAGYKGGFNKGGSNSYGKGFFGKSYGPYDHWDGGWGQFYGGQCFSSKGYGGW